MYPNLKELLETPYKGPMPRSKTAPRPRVRSALVALLQWEITDLFLTERENFASEGPAGSIFTCYHRPNLGGYRVVLSKTAGLKRWFPDVDFREIRHFDEAFGDNVSDRQLIKDACYALKVAILEALGLPGACTVEAYYEYLAT